MPRIIYSLHLDCERVPGEPITAFVVNLDRQGNGVPGGIRPIGKARVVDLRLGDWILHRPTGTTSRCDDPLQSMHCLPQQHREAQAGSVCLAECDDDSR